jgi:hypothetical protein
MNENEKPTVMPMRIMRTGLPPADTVGRLLVRHKGFGFMIGEMLPASGPDKPPVLCAVGIETGAARTPVCIMAVGDQILNIMEWMPLIDSDNPTDRVRASAAEARRNA